MSTIDLECDCGNPAHEPICYLRKGYVQVTHPDGKVEERWDQLYLTVSDNTAKGYHEEVMMEPDQARMIMWWFVQEYMPGISYIIRMWRKIRYHTFPLRERLKKLFS